MLLWLLTFAAVDFVASSAQLLIAELGVGTTTPMGQLPVSLSDHLRFALTHPVALTATTLAVCTVIAKLVLLWRVVFAARAPARLAPAWVPWLMAAVAVGLWWLAFLISISSQVVAARYSVEHLATQALAAQIGNMVTVTARPLLFAGALLAAYYRWQHLLNKPEAPIDTGRGTGEAHGELA